MPRATILLTGSLSVGEGRFFDSDEGEALNSDYDIVVLTRSCRDAVPAIAHGKLKGAFQQARFLADIEMTLVWEPLIPLRFTTTAGRIIAGDLRFGFALERMRAPRAASALANAYCILAGTPIAPPPARGHLLSKALVKAAQAFLLEECSRSLRADWMSLSSMRVIRTRLERDRRTFREPEMTRLKQACADLLGEGHPIWNRDSFSRAGEILEVISRAIPCPVSPFQACKHASWLITKGLPAMPRPSAGTHALRGLRLLSTAWGADEKPGPHVLLEAAREVSLLVPRIRLSGREPAEDLYRRLYGILKSYVTFYPNKLTYRRARGPAALHAPGSSA
jgi:hypothetical protein